MKTSSMSHLKSASFKIILNKFTQTKTDSNAQSHIRIDNEGSEMTVSERFSARTLLFTLPDDNNSILS